MSLEPSGTAGELIMTYWAATEDPSKAAGLAFPDGLTMIPVRLASKLAISAGLGANPHAHLGTALLLLCRRWLTLLLKLVTVPSS